MFKVLLRHLSAVDVSHEEGEGVEDEGAASKLICELLCELTLLICALKTWRLADIAWQHTSAYVSIRQHTSAYVSIRHMRVQDLATRRYFLTGAVASVFVLLYQESK